MAGSSEDTPSWIISERLRPIAPSPTLTLTAKAKELRAAGKPVISLAAGEPDFKVPTEVIDSITSALASGYARYTPTSGTIDLKEAVCRKVKRDQNIDISPKNVAISCGAKHSLYNLFQVLINPGDEVLIPQPYWVSYPEMVKLAGGVPVLVDTSQNEFKMTSDLIEKHISSKTRIVLLNSPSNPTGAILSNDELLEISHLLNRKNLFCISDEIYEYYIYDQSAHVSIAQLMSEWTNNVAIVNGVSKSHSMTGLRIGYTIAHTDIIKKIGILQDHSTSNPTSVSQIGAIAALDMPLEHASNLRTQFEKRRNLTIDLVQSIPGLKIFKPGGAFYLFVSVKDLGVTASEFCERLLQEKYVAIIPGEGFGSNEFVRMSFAASDDDIREAVKRIKEWVEGLT